MKYGFVYLMANPAMRGFYKIGCTERAPHARLQELSASTAVPVPFELVCYIEVQDCHQVEASLHNYLADFRVNGSREFFGFHRGDRAWLHGLFKFHPEAYAFTPVDLHNLYQHDRDPFDPWEGWHPDVGPKMPDNAPMRLFEIVDFG